MGGERLHGLPLVSLSCQGELPDRQDHSKKKIILFVSLIIRPQLSGAQKLVEHLKSNYVFSCCIRMDVFMCVWAHLTLWLLRHEGSGSGNVARWEGYLLDISRLCLGLYCCSGQEIQGWADYLPAYPNTSNITPFTPTELIYRRVNFFSLFWSQTPCFPSSSSSG